MPLVANPKPFAGQHLGGGIISATIHPNYSNNAGTRAAGHPDTETRRFLCVVRGLAGVIGKLVEKRIQVNDYVDKQAKIE